MLLLTTTILQCPSERSNELISLWSKCNALRTIYRPSESISLKDFRFCFVVQAQLYQSATRLEQNTATRLKLWVIGYWWLAMGYWVLAIGDWVLAMWYGRQSRISVPLHSTAYTLRFTLQAIATMPFASNLSPFRLMPCQRQCFDADAIGRCRSGTK